MIIYPAIDLREGKCVRLVQGRADEQTTYREDPLEVAREFIDAGASWIHMVDLDGAFSGVQQNLTVVEAIANLGIRVQLGGGLRDTDAVRRTLDAGVTRAVIGTRACESPEFVRGLVEAFGERIAAGIDAKDGLVAVKGWVEQSDREVLPFARQMEALGVGTLIYTDISTDGMLTGPNLAAQEALAAEVGCEVIASGGVGDAKDILALAEIKKRRPNLAGVIVGKAIYEKKIDLSKILRVFER